MKIAFLSNSYLWPGVAVSNKWKGRSTFKQSDRSHAGLGYHFEKFRDEKNGL